MKGKRKIAMLLTISMLMTLLTGIFSVGSVTVNAAYPDPLGKYITPLGAGLKDGSSWENAYDFRTKTFSTAWGSVPSNGTLYVGSGTYNSASVSATSSGQSSTTPKKILGVDTGSGKPVVHGTFVATSSSGPTFFNISSGVNNISVENIRVENYYIAVKTNGNQSYITVKNVDTYVSCYSIYLNGGGTNSNTLKLSNVTVDSCNFYYYTKTGIRMQNRTEDALITNCLADAGGIDYFINDPAIYWPVGFCQLADTDTPNMFENRITYVDCTAKNSYVDLGPTEYWNGDGFTTERNANNISYIRCKAYGNTDGGWDCKAETISLTDCVAMDNKRNIRLWGTATVTNCLSAYSYKRGGGYSSSGLWSGGPVTANYCTFYNNQGAQVETDTGLGGSLVLNDCIVGTNIFGKTLYTGGAISKNRTLDYNIESCTVDPRIKVYDSSYFYGDDDRYNSQTYGNTKGYYCVTSNVYPTPTPAPVTPTPVPSTGVTNLLVDNFDRYIDVENVKAGGWSMVTPTPTTVASPILAATEAPANYKYLRSVTSTSVSRTFAPIALKAAGGASPGINAKLVISFDAYTSGGTGADQAFWQVKDSATGYNAVSAGRRGSTAAVRYSKSIPATFTGLTISSGLTRFTTLKFVIKITDDTGAFLSTGPKVDVYCGDMANPIAGGTDVNMIDTATTKVDRFYMGGASMMEVDNLSITLDTNSPVNKTALDTKMAEANTLYTTASSNIGTRGGQYEQADVTALSNAITSAQSVYNNSSATQNDVDTAVTNLQAAMDACTPIPIDKSALSTKLAEANALYAIASSNIGTGYGQYDAAGVSALSAAITSAQAVYDNASATQDDVDAAVVSLQTAISNCTPKPTPITTTLINDDFNGYADINAMQAAGWAINFGSTTAPTPTTPALATTAAPEYAQFFRCYANTSVTKTFAPVPLTAAGGTSPGKNAKLTIMFDGYIGGTSGSNYQSYFKISNSIDGYVAVAAGRRNATTSIKYSKSIAVSGDTSPVIISSAPRYTKFKFVIKITDENGAFFTGGPKVDVYASDMNTPVAALTDVAMIDTATTSVDRFYMGGSQLTEVDNLNISLAAE